MGCFVDARGRCQRKDKPMYNMHISFPAARFYVGYGLKYMRFLR